MLLQEVAQTITEKPDTSSLQSSTGQDEKNNILAAHLTKQFPISIKNCNKLHQKRGGSITEEDKTRHVLHERLLKNVFIFIKQVFVGSKIINKAQELTRQLIFNYNLPDICIFSNRLERKRVYKNQELVAIMKHHFIFLPLSNVV